MTSAGTTSTSPQSKVAKTPKSDDMNGVSPPTKKQRTTSPTVSRQESSDSSDKCVDSEIRKSEGEDMEKAVDGSETMQQSTDPVADKLGGTGEKKEGEGTVTEPASKSEEVAAAEDMEVGEEEKGQSVQEQVAEKTSTPKRGSKAGTTPGSGKKKKATHPFFSE